MGLTRAQLTAIAQRTGYPVRAAWVPGHGTMGTVEGVVMHHTATPQSAQGDYPSLNVVTKGRPGLEGPLCNFGLGRSGTIYLVTEGIAWHAGVGAWKGITDGNGHFLGIEGEHPGIASQPWPATQYDAYTRLVASILNFIGRNTDWDIRHATWALPAGRKIDTVFTPAYSSQGAFDTRVKVMLANPASINRTWKPAPPAPKPTPVKVAGTITGRVPLLTYGMRDPIPFGGGQYIHRVQQLLRVPLTGVYDAATVAAVRKMNAELLKRNVDGRTVDAATWRRMYGLM
jgi:hypothetical protein